MKCPKCSAWSEVLQTNMPRRKRECANGHRFWTRETYEDKVTITYLTSGELAQRWRIDPKTLANWRNKGRGPAYIKLGEGTQAKVLYPQEAVLAYEQAGVRLPARGGQP